MDAQDETRADYSPLEFYPKERIRRASAFTGLGLIMNLLITLLLAGLNLGCQNATDEKETDTVTVFRELGSRDLKVRRAAVESLVSLASSPKGDRAIRENLESVAQIIANKREDPEVRGQSVRAIATVSERQFINQKYVPMLIEILLDEKEDETVRSWIAMTLPDLAPPEVATPPILAASRSENVNVRENASAQVARLRLEPERLLIWLQRGIKDPNMSIRLAAICAAGELLRRDKRALTVLLRGTSDREATVRQTAIQLLMEGGVLGDDKKDVRAAFEKLRQDPNPGVAMHATVALMELVPKDAAKYLPAVIKGLQADDAKLQEAAAQALAMSSVEAEAAVPSLKSAVTDSADQVKVHAAMTLIRLTGKPDEYVDVLRELEQSADVGVMMWAKLYRAIVLAESEEQEKKRHKQDK